jgi:hypothetical protein
MTAFSPSGGLLTIGELVQESLFLQKSLVGGTFLPPKNHTYGF